MVGRGGGCPQLSYMELELQDSHAWPPTPDWKQWKTGWISKIDYHNKRIGTKEEAGNLNVSMDHLSVKSVIDTMYSKDKTGPLPRLLCQ